MIYENFSPSKSTSALRYNLCLHILETTYRGVQIFVDFMRSTYLKNYWILAIEKLLNFLYNWLEYDTINPRNCLELLKPQKFNTQKLTTMR